MYTLIFNLINNSVTDEEINAVLDKSLLQLEVIDHLKVVL